MAEKFKKIDKEFLLTDNSVNTYGFRLLTDGYLMDEYKKNPIGYYMHERSNGVLVRWSDFRKDGDKVFAKANINLSHPRGERTVDEIESGFLNAASLGHFVVIEMNKTPQNPLPNQTGPDVTKWFNRECSLVDIPGNFNSLKLFDENDHELNLADFTKTNFKHMQKSSLTAEQLAKLNLTADAADDAVAIAFDNLVAQAAKVPQLEQQLAAANQKVADAENALTALKESQKQAEINSLIDAALNDKKITVEVGNNLKVAYKDNVEGLKTLIAAMPAYTSVVGQLKTYSDEIAALAAKSYDELDKSGELEMLKAKAPDVFKELYKKQWGKEYAE